MVEILGWVGEGLYNQGFAKNIAILIFYEAESLAKASDIWNQYFLFLTFAAEIDERRERRPFPSSFFRYEHGRSNRAKGQQADRNRTGCFSC
jgi:hypothetical protein